jgi:hypothetical protein
VSLARTLAVSITVATTDGPIEFSDACIDAIRRRAEFVASLVGETIRRMLDLPQQPDGQVHQLNVPAGFLLELGAVIVLKLWERQGITRHVDAGLPSWSDADADLARRFNEDPRQFDRLDNASLSQRVLKYWVENFAWDGIETFGADVLLSTADEDAIVDAVARFLYENRNALETLLPDKENDP